MKTTTKNTIIRQKQSLVHKVPSGVAILSHVCGGAAIVHPQGKIKIFIPGKCGERQGILVSICENMNWESPPSILVTRNPNWSQRLGTKNWLRKGKVLAPQLRPT